MKTRYRRSSKLMKSDPYTLVIALDEEGSASGKLYVDDGETFAQGTEVIFTVDNNIINAKRLDQQPRFHLKNNHRLKGSNNYIEQS